MNPAVGLVARVAGAAPAVGASPASPTGLHRLPPEVKVVAAVLFVTVVALTPQRATPVLGLQLAAVIAVVVAARLRPGMVVRRLAVVAPFLLTAAILPLVAGGERTEIAGIGLSVDGLWSASAIGAKTMIGALTSIVVASTTPTPALLAGLGRLRLPPTLVAIASFMVRYLDLLLDELRRRRVAMLARAWRPRWLGHAGPVAATMGTMFVRSYERGERVHAAMVSRGYTGTMPAFDNGPRVRTSQWLLAALPALFAAAPLAVWMLAR